MDATTRIALEVLYRALLGAVVQLARVLGEPCPIVRREDRRQQARELLRTLDQR